MWHYGDFGWMNFGLHGLGMLLVWGLIILAIIAVVRALTNPARQAAPVSSGKAPDILRERYARGELSVEQFTAMKKDLEV